MKSKTTRTKKNFPTTTLHEILTQGEIEAALKLFWTDRIHFHGRCRKEIIAPVLNRINQTLGQENDADYLSYAIEFALMIHESEQKAKRN